MTLPKIDTGDIKEVSNLIWGALDRVAREQGDDVAAAAAIKNLHGNIAYLREAIGDIDVVELLGELREVVLQHALARCRSAG